jgi:hypothetical protein
MKEGLGIGRMKSSKVEVWIERLIETNKWFAESGVSRESKTEPERSLNEWRLIADPFTGIIKRNVNRKC